MAPIFYESIQLEAEWRDFLKEWGALVSGRPCAPEMLPWLHINVLTDLALQKRLLSLVMGDKGLNDKRSRLGAALDRMKGQTFERWKVDAHPRTLGTYLVSDTQSRPR